VAILPDATNAEVRTAVTTLLDRAGMGGAGYSITITPADVYGLHPGATVSVRTSVPYAGLKLLGMAFIPVPPTLRSEVVMAKEGP
jgi:hypothetical protein